jgi:DNA-directed RNA polymerase subunit H (RpoH/RPB5)
MALSVYPPIVIVRTILDDFFAYRGLHAAPRGLAPSAEVRVFNDDEVISDMEQFFYIRLDALRDSPRGGRDWVVVLILGGAGKYAHHSPDLRKLLDGVGAERPSKEGRLDELIVVAEDEFFTKKNLTDVIGEMQTTGGSKGLDPDGLRPFFSAYRYCNFTTVVPEQMSVPPHRVMSGAEVEDLLTRLRKVLRDLPTIYTSDPPVIWLGARTDQVVEITRPSQTAAISLYYRRVEWAAF